MRGPGRWIAGLVGALALVAAAPAFGGGEKAGGGATGSGWFDRSHRIFFPAELERTVSVQQAFPAFWWDFVVVEAPGGDPAKASPGAICPRLKASLKGVAERIECGQSLEDYRQVLEDWTRDLPLRTERPTDERIRRGMDAALAKAALPSAEPGLLPLLRLDPLETWRDLQKHAEKRLRLKLERRNGVFYDAPSGNQVIPLQLGFEPSQAARTREAFAGIRCACAEAGSGCGAWTMVGPHASALNNEDRITEDTNAVSWVGTVVLAIYILSLVFSGRWRVVLTVPAVMIGMSVSVLATIAIFGSIHGLTLSFGSGIIGLALDYGLHASLSRHSKQVWKANFLGFLTTAAGLLVLMCSSIPLLRQLMAFSTIGLGAAFLALYLMMRRSPEFFEAQPVGIDFQPRPWRTAGVAALLALALAGIGLLKPNLDMRQFDYQPEHARQVSQWLFSKLEMRSPLFRLHEAGEALKAAHEERAWAESQGITVENVASYVPAGDAQIRNLASWGTGAAPSECGARGGGALSETQRRFFAPFLESQLCRAPAGGAASAGGIPSDRSYLRHLSDGRGRWLTLWLPATDAEELRVRERFPDALSLRDVALGFPKALARELAWMAPLSVLIAAVLLLRSYRRLRLALVALLPFGTGLGLMALAKLVFGLDSSFMTLIGLVMVFGFSIDYGIFVVDLFNDPEADTPQGVWTAVTFAAATNLAGFVPLLFCQHPVLRHLGQALFFGTLGTFIGAAWGIPAFIGRRAPAAPAGA